MQYEDKKGKLDVHELVLQLFLIVLEDGKIINNPVWTPQ